jgi:hypothetical protein
LDGQPNDFLKQLPQQSDRGILMLTAWVSRLGTSRADSLQAIIAL